MKIYVRLFALSLLIAGSLCAQGTSAQIVGRIVDPSGGAVPAASVRLTNADTGIARAVQSAESGAYVFPLLAPGNYRLTVVKDGFRPVNRTGITLVVDQVARIDVDLELGAMTQEIQVSNAAPVLEQETCALWQ